VAQKGIWVRLSVNLDKIAERLTTTSGADATRNHHAVALLQQLNHLNANLLLKNLACLLWLCPMSAITTGSSQSASVKVNALASELPAQLRILVVEVLDCITEAVAVPVHNDHIAINACQILHLLVHILPDVWWHDADSVADTDDNLWAAAHVPLCRKLIIDQLISS